MSNVRKVKEDLFWVGVNDMRIERFENIHPVPKGVSYNSWLLLDEKTVLFDAVDWSGGRLFMENVREALGGRALDYFIVEHMEPDHAACMEEVLKEYPDCKVIGTGSAFRFMEQFGFGAKERKIVVKDGDALCFGAHTIVFFTAAMVHWPEVMVCFDKRNGCLFSADAFGTFGTLNGKLFADEMDFEKECLAEARRYYCNIIGKYGVPVQRLLKKLEALPVRMLCPLHGPVWRKDLPWYLEKYGRWSRWEPEESGVLIVYGSMYGHTEAAAWKLAEMLCERGMTKVAVYDASAVHVSYLVAEAFRYSHIVLASCTYNMEIFPPVQDLLHHLSMQGLTGRTFGIVENGTWAVHSGALMKDFIEKNLKGSRILEQQVSLLSSMKPENETQLSGLADALAGENCALRPLP